MSWLEIVGVVALVWSFGLGTLGWAIVVFVSREPRSRDDYVMLLVSWLLGGVMLGFTWEVIRDRWGDQLQAAWAWLTTKENA